MIIVFGTNSALMDMWGAKINRLEVDPALGDSITMESELMPIKNICDR